MLKRNKGITLIALVVTIIVLLILAGVTLSFVAGENGILKRATTAVEVNEKATAEEEANLLVADLVARYYEEKYVNQKEVGELDEYLKTELGTQKETEGGFVVISDTEGNVSVSKDGKSPISIGKIENGRVNWTNQDKGEENPEKDNKTARYILVEINGYIGEADGAVINELEVYDKDLTKCHYTILKDLEYDSTKSGKSTYWENPNFWNYTNLNDGVIAYPANTPGNANCTLFLNEKNGNVETWARFVIDLGEEKELGRIKIAVGGYDELSPNHSRTPQRVSFYKIKNFIDGIEENSTYANHIMKQNNSGLSKIGEKSFSDIVDSANWFEVLEYQNDKNYAKARYVLFEVNGYLDGGMAVLNEINLVNQYNENIIYNVLSELEYDSKRNGPSYYWTDMRYWNYTNLNDGAVEYKENYPSGGQNCTIFLLQEGNATSDSDAWARFVIDLGEERYLREIEIWLGGVERRMPQTINIYAIENFVDGTDENTTYAKNVKDRENNGLQLISTKTFETVLTAVEKINMLNN